MDKDSPAPDGWEMPTVRLIYCCTCATTWGIPDFKEACGGIMRTRDFDMTGTIFVLLKTNKETMSNTEQIDASKVKNVSILRVERARP